MGQAPMGARHSGVSATAALYTGLRFEPPLQSASADADKPTDANRRNVTASHCVVAGVPANFQIRCRRLDGKHLVTHGPLAYRLKLFAHSGTLPVCGHFGCA